MSWYTKTVAEVLNDLNSQEHGLSKQEADKRISTYGANKLPEGKVDSLLAIFFRQFQSPLIYILFAATTIVFIKGEAIDALIIAAVLVFNSVIGAFQEGRAQNALLALKKITETSATVVRDGKELVIRDDEIVPGDIILLQEGERVPADARIISVSNLKIDEASLTGESEAILKTNTVIDANTSELVVSDQKNMVFKGTYILSGNGTAIVVATGFNTEIGKIAQKISNIETEIPLKNNIRYLSQMIILVVMVISLSLFLLGIFSGRSPSEMFSMAVALSVSIIPEGLPIVMTLVLATGVRRMSRHNVLVKRLQAVEALGQTKVVAVDKTGTLTMNEMLVEKVFVDNQIFEVAGSGYEPKGEVALNGKMVDPLNHGELLFIGKLAAFCTGAKVSFREDSGTWKVSGDPTEAAVLVFSQKIGFFKEVLDQESPQLFELPFDYRQKFRATVRQVGGNKTLTVIGAPEKLLGTCERIWVGGRFEKITDKKRNELTDTLHQFAGGGLRVIAVAVNTDFKGENLDTNLSDLAFVGFLGMRDSLRPEVKESMRQVRSAGMRVVMITGDHRLTAESIAKEAGIWQDQSIVITGEEIESLSDDQLSKMIGRTSVFARVTPEHKLRIIEAFRRGGEVVAMTGDGVNDAPSLVAADLGVAMGKIGTEVAKEASDIVLLDDNFANIVRAAEEGRFIYKTIKRVILYLFSTSIGEVLTIVGAIVLGYPLPLLAAQIIWLNFITDPFLGITLAMEPKEHDLMHGSFPKPKKWIVDNLMLSRMFRMAVPMALGALYLFINNIESDLTKAWSISLTTLAMFQWFNAWNCRSESRSVFGMNPFSNKPLLAATLFVVGLQFLALHLPFFQKILRTTPLSAAEWAMIIPIAGSIVFIEEVRKFFYRLKLAKQTA